MEKINQSGLLFLGALLAIGIALCGYFVSQTMYNARVALNTAEVKGLSERRVQADRANWDVGFSFVHTGDADIAELYEKAEKNQAVIVDALKEIGFSDDEIKVGIIEYYYREFRDDDNVIVEVKHEFDGSISVETDKVDLISTARGKVNKLIAKGIYVDNNAPRYYFTKLNEIKPDMLREATHNARIAANEFAKNAGAQVGRIRDARQGGFIIRDAGEEYGDTEKIEKDVRIVTTITFYLND